MKVLEKIEAEIAFHKERLDKLSTTRDVLLEIEAGKAPREFPKTKNGSPASREIPESEQSSGDFFTPIKAQQPSGSSKPVKASRRGQEPKGKTIKDRVLDVLKGQEEPVSSAFISESLPDVAKQSLFGALAHMVKSNVIVKSDDRMFSLPKPSDSEG